MTDVETGACSYFLILLEDTYATWLTLLCRCVGLNRLAKLGGELELEAPPQFSVSPSSFSLEQI